MRADRWDLVDKETGAQTDLFTVLCEQELRRSLRYRDFITLLMLGPDRKLRASETLETLTTLLEKAIRETDSMAQIGDAKFAIMLPGCNLEAAYIVASRIMDHISNFVFPREKGQHLTSSIGGVCFPTTATSLEVSDLFREAENALETARKKGNSIFLPDWPDETPLFQP